MCCCSVAVLQQEGEKEKEGGEGDTTAISLGGRKETCGGGWSSGKDALALDIFLKKNIFEILK